MIDRNSRYAEATVATHVDAKGRERRHVVPPLLPHPDVHGVGQVHRVTDSDRPDTLAARAYGQAAAWWLIANANTADHPDALTEPAGVERVLPRPEGMG